MEPFFPIPVPFPQTQLTLEVAIPSPSLVKEIGSGLSGNIIIPSIIALFSGSQVGNEDKQNELKEKFLLYKVYEVLLS